MSWRDQLLDASFRGAQFKVSNSVYNVGRRNELHQYINRDTSYLEDFGQESDRFDVEGYIISNSENAYNYFVQRDQLIKALKREGLGILIHPFLGIKKVGLIGEASISENFNEGGIARFKMTFVESDERKLPFSLADVLQKVDEIVNKVNDKMGDFFYKVYDTTAAFMDIGSSFVNLGVNTIKTATTTFKGVGTKVINETQANLSILAGGISTAITSPIDLFNITKDAALCVPIAIAGMGRQIFNEVTSDYGVTVGNEVSENEKAIDNYIESLIISDIVLGGETGEYSGVTRGDVTELNGEVVPYDLAASGIDAIISVIEDDAISNFSPIPKAQQLNILYIKHILNISLLANACRIAIRADYLSKQDAIYILEKLTTQIETLLLEIGTAAAYGPAEVGIGINTEITDVDNTELFNALDEVRQAFVENMYNKISNLSKEIDYTVPNYSENILTLAYRRYNDITRGEEIYNNNLNVTNPAFLPAGQTIQILDK